MNWQKSFDERQLKEISFSQVYSKKFSHGTDGHNAKLIIAKMAEMLNDIETILTSNGNKDTFSSLYHILNFSVEEEENYREKK